MRRNPNRLWFLILLFMISLVLGNGLLLAESPTVADSFRTALKNRDVRGFNGLVASDGLLLVRSYNPNDLGRGADILLRVSRIPATFQVPVSNDFPFDLPYLFGWTIRSKTLISLSDSLSGNALSDHSIAAIRNFAYRMMERVSQASPSFVPTTVQLADGWVILCEATLKQGLLSGAFAVFERSGNQNRLKMIIDLR